jgi:hypothetical protein
MRDLRKHLVLETVGKQSRLVGSRMMGTTTVDGRKSLRNHLLYSDTTHTCEPFLEVAAFQKIIIG